MESTSVELMVMEEFPFGGETKNDKNHIEI